MGEQTMAQIAAVDLFCGAGGLTYGLRKSKISVVAGVDIDESCKYAYEYNNRTPFVHSDISKVDPESIKALFPQNSIKLLAGCAPCQPFSKYNRFQGDQTDIKWPLLYSFAALIESINPELVTMENVPGVVNHSVYHDFVKSLGDQGYHVQASTIYCPDYGIPQTRKRHVLLASKFGPISIVKKTHTPDQYKTVADAISQLPPLKAGEQDPKDSLHRCPSLSDLNLKRIKYSVQGGSWKDWPSNLQASCHKKSSGQNYRSVYARMKWDEPSPTITTQSYGYGNGRFGHPDQNRAISLREAATLQTFPKSYRFVKPNKKPEFRPVGKMIGNAVPVLLGKVIGDSFRRHISN